MNPNKHGTNAHQWLHLGMASVGIATLLAVLLIAGKTPLLSGLLPDENSFQRALVLHVDLNMTLWVGAIACFFWGRDLAPWVNRVGALLAATGFGLWLLTYGTDAKPILNNYMPVFDSLLYFAGLSLILLGFAWMALQWLIAHLVTAKKHPAFTRIEWSLMAMAFLLLAAIANGLLSLLFLDTLNRDITFFEQLFWGPGHIWQLFALQIMVSAWLTFLPLKANTNRAERWLFSLPLIAAGAGAIAPWLMDPSTEAYRHAFTQYMRYGSLWVLPVVAWVFTERAPVSAASRLSAGLFGLGIVIGTLIRADNLMVPAHYHAMTGAVNLIIMAFVMVSLSPKAFDKKIVRFQAYAYTIGVFMLATGLAWSGAMGGMRKVTMAAQLVQDWQHLAVLTMMGIGGLLAIGGIFLFLGISLSNLGRNNQLTPKIALEH